MGQHDSKRSARRRQDDALRQELLCQAADSRAQCCPDSRLVCPGRGANEQQIGDVRTSDEKHQRNRAEQYVESRADWTEYCVLEWFEKHASSSVGGWILAFEVCSDGRQLVLSKGRRRRILETTDDEQAVVLSAKRWIWAKR